jgi:O-glycosyl hydrolase
MIKRIGLALMTVVPALACAQPVHVRFDANLRYQTIQNFGASDAWSCQFVGGWPEAKREAIADWLFSTDTLADGSPKGIGLSLWRFNIGAGTAEQGAASGIRDDWRRTPAFANTTGPTPRRDAQFWFIKAAAHRGVQQFLGFFNSAPPAYTVNGKAYADKGQPNLDSAHFDAVATYAVDALHLTQQATGVHVNYLSPVNEPQWDWSDGSQEGSPYTNDAVASLCRALDRSIRRSDLRVKLITPEAGHLKYLLGDDDKPGRGNQIAVLFQPASTSYIGNLPTLMNAVAAHGYFTTSPASAAVDIRRRVKDCVATIPGLQYWMTEYCILGDNGGEIDGRGRDTGMNSALYVARVIHDDLVEGNASAWHWWLALSPYNYKDGLIYVSKTPSDGDYHDTKLLWAFGNYCRFVRPGMQRMAVETDTCPGLSVSGFTEKDARRKVLVFVNSDSVERTVLLDGRYAGTITVYTTDQNHTLKKSKAGGKQLTIPARSIVSAVLSSQTR